MDVWAGTHLYFFVDFRKMSGVYQVNFRLIAVGHGWGAVVSQCSRVSLS